MFSSFYIKSPKCGMYFIPKGDLKLGNKLSVVKIKCSSAKTMKCFSILSYQNSNI